jgi:hypothetical protein
MGFSRQQSLAKKRERDRERRKRERDRERRKREREREIGFLVRFVVFTSRIKSKT